MMEHFVFGFILFLAIGVVIWNSSRSKAKQTDVNEEVVKKETEEVLEKIRAEREIKPAPVASLEPVVTPEPVVEKTVTVESKAEAIEAVVEKKNKRIAKATIKKPAAKKTKAKVNG